MVQIIPFEVEEWMNEYETKAVHNLAETCCESISLEDLQSLSGDTGPLACIDSRRKLTYGAIEGSTALRSNLAQQYCGSQLGVDDVLTTNGAISANFLVHYTLVKPGDHVICQYPTYQQLYSGPEMLGAEVTLWKSDAEKKWAYHTSDLESMIKPNTKMIIINNPQNPTGSALSGSTLEAIVAIAHKHKLIIHSDEVYWPLLHPDPSTPTTPPPIPSILELNYPNSIATGSLSKAYSLAGIRVGWLASPNKSIITACAAARHYTTIAVSQVDEQIATVATSHSVRAKLLQRNIALAVQNKAAVQALIDEFAGVVEWVPPVAGTTGLIRIRGKDGVLVDDVAFCKALQEETGTMLVPASRCFGGGRDFEGCVRIGYVCAHEELVKGLGCLKGYLGKHFAWTTSGVLGGSVVLGLCS